MIDLFRSVFLARAYETESHDGGVAVLLDANVFRGINRASVAGLGSPFLADFAQNVGLADVASGRSGVDQIVRPKPLVIAMSFRLAPARKSCRSLVSSVASGAVCARSPPAMDNNNMAERKIRFMRLRK